MGNYLLFLHPTVPEKKFSINNAINSIDFQHVDCSYANVRSCV